MTSDTYGCASLYADRRMPLGHLDHLGAFFFGVTWFPLGEGTNDKSTAIILWTGAGCQ